MRLPFAAAFALGVLFAFPALADCSVDHAFVDHQITEGIFRPNRFTALPLEIPQALRLITEGRRDEAKALFAVIGQMPQAQWPNLAFGKIVLDARWSAWLLDDCPPP